MSIDKIDYSDFNTVENLLNNKIFYFISDYTIHKIKSFTGAVTLELKIEKGITKSATLVSKAKTFYLTKQDAHNAIKDIITGQLSVLNSYLIAGVGYFDLLSPDIMKAADKYGIEVNTALRESYNFHRKLAIEREQQRKKNARYQKRIEDEEWNDRFKEDC